MVGQCSNFFIMCNYFSMCDFLALRLIRQEHSAPTLGDMLEKVLPGNSFWQLILVDMNKLKPFLMMQ